MLQLYEHWASWTANPQQIEAVELEHFVDDRTSDQNSKTRPTVDELCSQHGRFAYYF